MPKDCRNKGRKKRKATQFRSEDQCKSPPPIREASSFTRQPYELREDMPNPNTESSHEYFISNVGRQQIMWNNSHKHHIEKSPKCKGFLQLCKKQQLIISTSWFLKCNTCSFEGEVYKMYIESHINDGTPGRKPSSLNLALGAALIKSPIGPSVLSEIFLTLGIDPGSAKGLQMAMNISGNVIVELGYENLAAERHRSNINDDGTGDTILFDTRYNNPIFGSIAPHTFQPATQAVTTIVSHRTNKVIDIIFANKHCPKKWYNIKVNCGDGSHQGCVANLRPEDSIGDEGKYIRQSARNLKKAGYNVKATCSDRDTKAAEAFENEWDSPIEKLVDPLHLARGQKRQFTKSSFSEDMFYGKTKADRSLSRKRFAEEIKQRCTAEITTAINSINLCSSNNSGRNPKDIIQQKLQSTPFAVAECYKGNHTYCKSHSMVCKPDKKWEKFCLKEEMREAIVMTPRDEINLRQIIRVRLAPSAIAQTYGNISTNKCESMNKAYGKTNPKAVLSTTNFQARILASVLTNNLGTYEATRLIQNTMNHNVSPNIIKKLKQHSDKIQKRKDQKKSLKCKSARVKRKKNSYTLHNMKLSEIANEKKEKKNISSRTRSKKRRHSALEVDEGEELYPYQTGKVLLKDISLEEGHDRILSQPGPSKRYV